MMWEIKIKCLSVIILLIHNLNSAFIKFTVFSVGNCKNYIINLIFHWIVFIVDWINWDFIIICHIAPSGRVHQFRGVSLQVPHSLGRLPPPPTDPRPAEQHSRCSQFPWVLLSDCVFLSMFFVITISDKHTVYKCFPDLALFPLSTSVMRCCILEICIVLRWSQP